MILNKQAIPGLLIAYQTAKSYEDKMWYGFLIKVCEREYAKLISKEFTFHKKLYINPNDFK